MNDGGVRLVKYSAGAVVLALYATISAWIIAGQGESYRKSIARKPALVATTPVDPEVPPDPIDEPVRSIASATQPGPAPTPEPAKPPEPKPSVAIVEHPAAPKLAEPPAKAAPARPLDAFWDEPDQRKIYDFDQFTAKDEQELGQTLHRMVLHDHNEIDVGPLLKRLEDAAKPYLAARTRKDVEYTFTVLDCPRLNVFSHPGGYIYVCKGLFDWIAEDEDYALGFILAHEIAHVDLAHAIICMRDPEIKKNFKFGTSFFFYAALIPGGYLKQQDLDADRWAVDRMFKAGRTRYEVLAFLRRLEDYARSNGFENKRKAPNDEPKVPILDNHIRAHPIPRTRLEDVKAIIDRLPKI
jgi:hypothetical protein